MPVMEVIEATKIIREKNGKYKDIPITFFTVNTPREDKNKYRELGMSDFIILFLLTQKFQIPPKTI